MDKDYDASTVWQVLQQWLNTDVEGQILLKLLKEDLQLGLQQLGDWLTTRTSQTPVQLATYVSGGQIEKLINIVSSTVIFQLSGSAFVVPSLHQLPSPPADFIGRQAEFDELLSKVHQSGIAILCLRGMGGIGKTSFALVLAKTLKSFCPDAQILLDLKGANKQKALTPFQAMELIIRAFYPESNLPNNIDKLTNVYRSLFYNKRILLLLDNAKDSDQVRPLLPPEGCITIITSRKHFNLPGFFALDLEILPPNDARNFLLRIIPRIEEKVDEIAKLCGYLPLALRFAADALSHHKTLSVADYLTRLAKEQERLKLIEASISLSYKLLNRKLQKLWQLLSIFPDSFDLNATTALWSLERDPTQDALDDLVSYSLLEWNEISHRYNFHNLVRLFASKRLDNSEKLKAQELHSTYYLNILNLAHKYYLKGGEQVLNGLRLFDAELTNIQAGQAWAATHATKNDQAARLSCEYPNAGVHILLLRFHPQEYAHWLEVALRVARQLNFHKDECNHLGNLGTAYLLMGDYQKAIELITQAIILCQETGNSREWTWNVNLLIAYKLAGKGKNTIKDWQQLLANAQKIGDRRCENVVLGNLGIVYKELGDIDMAIKCQEQALKISKDSGDLQAQGQDLGNLGNAYAKLGDIKRAVECYEERLSIALQIGDKRGECYALSNLGDCYRNLASNNKSIDYLKQALQVAHELSNKEIEGRILSNLGQVYFSLSNAYKAIECYQQALKIFEENKNKEQETKELINLGEAYYSINNASKAIEYFERGLAISREIKYQQSESVILNNLGTVFATLLNDKQKAIDFYEQNLVIVRETGDIQGEATVLNSLGFAYVSLGNMAKVVECHEQALNFVQKNGDKEMEYLILGNLGLAYHSLGIYHRAIEYYKERLVMATKMDDKRGQAASFWNIALALKRLNQPKQAISYGEESLKIYEQIEESLARKVRITLAKWQC